MATFKLLSFFAVLCAVFFLSSTDAYGLGRIVGGKYTTITNRPYQASLVYYTGNVYILACGASIISNTFLLSAAHCKPSSLVNYSIRVGSSSFTTGGVLRRLTAFTVHPNYTKGSLDYDFAILKLQYILTLGRDIAIIPLASGSDPSDGSMVTVSGWGVTSESETIPSPSFKEVDLPVVNADKCREVYSNITSRQICLGGTPEGGNSACARDDGGPAVYDGVQIGLVSGGDGCGRPNIPGIYARISSVRDWITSLTGV